MVVVAGGVVGVVVVAVGAVDSEVPLPLLSVVVVVSPAEVAPEVVVTVLVDVVLVEVSVVVVVTQRLTRPEN